MLRLGMELPEQELASLEIVKTTAILVILESDLEQEGVLMIPTLVETPLGIYHMEEIRISKPWVTSWSSEKEKKAKKKKEFKNKNCCEGMSDVACNIKYSLELKN